MAEADRGVFGIIGAAALMMPASVVVAADYLTIDAAQKAIFPSADSFEPIVAAEPKSPAMRADAAGVARLKATTRDSAGLLFCSMSDQTVGPDPYAVASGRAARSPSRFFVRESHGARFAMRLAAPVCQSARTVQLQFRTDIKNISGATLSSEHVTQGVRGYWRWGNRTATAAISLLNRSTEPRARFPDPLSDTKYLGLDGDVANRLRVARAAFFETPDGFGIARHPLEPTLLGFWVLSIAIATCSVGSWRGMRRSVAPQSGVSAGFADDGHRGVVRHRVRTVLRNRVDWQTSRREFTELGVAIVIRGGALARGQRPPRRRRRLPGSVAGCDRFCEPLRLSAQNTRLEPLTRTTSPGASEATISCSGTSAARLA
jgi:hypothetical protein